MDHGQLARFRRWQDRTFHVDPRKVVSARRYSAFLAIALVALVIGAVYLAIRTSETLGSAVPFALIWWVAWRYVSFALSGPPHRGRPGSPQSFGSARSAAASCACGSSNTAGPQCAPRAATGCCSKT